MTTPTVIVKQFRLATTSTTSVLIDLEKYPAGTYAYNTSIASIALGILGASVTLSGLHYKAGNRLLSWQFGVINLYYFSEILMRCVLVAIAFVSVQEYAFIAVGIDVFLRGYVVAKGEKKDIDISMTCLYLGSDNALNNDKAWALGSIVTFIESLIFIIVMLTLDTDILHTLRTRQTAQHLCYVMLCSFFAKTGLYYYIEKKMESPKDDNVEYITEMPEASKKISAKEQNELKMLARKFRKERASEHNNVTNAETVNETVNKLHEERDLEMNTMN